MVPEPKRHFTLAFVSDAALLLMPLMGTAICLGAIWGMFSTALVRFNREKGQYKVGTKSVNLLGRT